MGLKPGRKGCSREKETRTEQIGEGRVLPPYLQPGLDEGRRDAVCTSYICVFGRSFLIQVLMLDSPKFSTGVLSHEITGNSEPHLGLIPSLS